MHSWFIRKWAAWCAGYRHACCSPARLCTSLAHHILMGCLSQLLITSHPSLYFDGESGKGVFRQSLLHLFFGPLLPLLLFVPSFWFWRGLWMTDCCFWLPSDSYSAASVMSADTAPGLVAMPSSEEEEGLSAWSVMRRGNGSDSLLGLVLILLFLNCSGSQYCNSVREGYPRGGKIKYIELQGRVLTVTTYIMNQAPFFVCQSHAELWSSLLASLVPCCSWRGPCVVLYPATRAHGATSVSLHTLSVMISLISTNQGKSPGLQEPSSRPSEHRPEYTLGVGTDITRASCLPATGHFT